MKKKIAVSGMMCAACSARLSRALGATQGITTVEVSLAEGLATVETELSDADLRTRIEEIGFAPGEITPL